MEKPLMYLRKFYREAVLKFNWENNFDNISINY